jgi:hypothetical protein
MRLLSVLSWLAFALAGAFSWLVDGGILIRPVPPELAGLPERLAGFELGAELPIEPGALGDLPPERTSYRRVRDAAGNEGVLFVAYYLRSRRASGRPHDVDLCYRSLGWQEQEARELEPGLWSRRLEREGRTVRVVHWLEHPGDEAAGLTPRAIVARLSSPRGLRPDVASIYFEFDAGAAPDEQAFVDAAHALSASLETLWR